MACQQQIADLFVVGRVKDDTSRLPVPPDHEYTFIEFFTYLIFQTSARYDPYFRLGYRHFEKAVNVREQDSVAGQILEDLFHARNAFNRDGSGIRKIFTVVDVKMLTLDLDNLTARASADDAGYVEDFKHYVTYLAGHDLGILSGLDLVAEVYRHAGSELPDLRDLKIESLYYQT